MPVPQGDTVPNEGAGEGPYRDPRRDPKIVTSLNKALLVDELATRLNMSKKDATDSVEAFIAIVVDSVAKGGKVSLTGFGVFERAERAARTGRNPLTGATVKISATAVPKFRPGTEFKTLVAGKKKAAKKAAPAKAVAKKAPAKAAAKKAAPAKAAPAKAAPVKAAAKKAPAKKAAAKR